MIPWTEIHACVYHDTHVCFVCVLLDTTWTEFFPAHTHLNFLLPLQCLLPCLQCAVAMSAYQTQTKFPTTEKASWRRRSITIMFSMKYARPAYAYAYYICNLDAVPLAFAMSSALLAVCCCYVCKPNANKISYYRKSWRWRKITIMFSTKYARPAYRYAYYICNLDSVWTKFSNHRFTHLNFPYPCICDVSQPPDTMSSNKS